MRNEEKTELRNIVKRIPVHIKENRTIVELWRRYAPQFSYAVFRKYLKALQSPKGDGR